MRGVASAIAFVLATTIATAAHADDPRAATLVYSAPDDCPDAASFRDQVSARLGTDPFVIDGTRRVEVTIEHAKGKLTGRVSFVSKDAEPTPARELAARGDRCGALVTALATTVAIELDAVSAPPDYWKPPIEEAPPPTTADAEPSPPPAPAAPAVLPPEPPKAEVPSDPLAVSAFVGIVGSLGVAPAFSFGPDVGVALGKRGFALELSARAESTFREVDVSSGDRVRASVYSGAIAPCLRFDRLDACVQARIGAFVGRAESVTDPHDAAAAYVALAARLGYAQPLGRWLALRGAFELGVPLAGETLEVGGREIWSNSAIFGTLSLALVVNFAGR